MTDKKNTPPPPPPPPPSVIKKGETIYTPAHRADTTVYFSPSPPAPPMPPRK